MDAVLGTAGHIDHGKTSLIRALTGINCDRLDEEKRRGITIELGFAWLDLPDGRRLGIVDVPGHEKFVKNMVAGASGIDCILLIIAADEGMMPQTREHLEICSLLGVRHGLVVLTKTDLVDAEWQEMVTEEIKGELAGTFLANAPVLPVSTVTGQGLGELHKAIEQLIHSLKIRQTTDILRLPVDRVFSLKGFGTVVTGTLVSGSCSQGESLVLMPSGNPLRVRSLQIHSVQVKEAHQGQRCAMNFQGIEVGDIQRGDIVSRSGSLFPSKRWIVKLNCLASSPHPIRQRMEAHFHHGAKECAARILFRDRTELAPGESALAELYFSEPLTGIYGDHFVLRAHSPLQTIGGGVLVDPLPNILKKRDPLYAQKMSLLEELAKHTEKQDSAEKLVLLTLSLRAAPGLDEKQLGVLTGLDSEKIKKALLKLEAQDAAICWDNQCWVSKNSFEHSLEECRKRAIELHEREPLKSAFAASSFFSGWGENLPQKYTQKVLSESVKAGILENSGNGLKLLAHQINLDAEQATLMEQLVGLYEKGKYSPPMLKEICEERGLDSKKILPLMSHLCNIGKLVKIQEGLYYSPSAAKDMENKIRQWFASHDNLDVGEIKMILDISRKYSIPFLEYLDGKKITRRIGNQRKLLAK